MGPPRSSKKRPQTNRAHRRVKEISRYDDAPRWPQRQVALRCLYIQRILPLVSSAFPRVTNRRMTAMAMSTAMAIPTFNGVIKPGPGVGVGVAEGGGGAFFAAN